MVINVLIFIVGLVVYAGYGWAGFAYLAAATLISYGTGLLTKKAKWVMWVAVALNAAMLTLLKLQSHLGLSLVAPLGVSYFTLQIIAYNVDVYKGKYEPERNLFRFALFVTYLPHLFIGPIERYDSMAPALFENRKMSWENFFAGAARALWGLFKKLVIASRAGMIISAISADPEAFRGAYALAAMLLYSVQLYADFSGGIDSVLGISQMLGVRMSENFDVPYLSQSFQEFWRRWHITLGSWLRNYVYIPLGGNRKGKVRKVINLIITFLVSGLWHGTQYILWGLFNGIFVAFGTKLQTKWKTLNRIGTVLLISFLWAFFVWPDMGTALKMTVSVFTTFNYGQFFAALGSFGLTVGDWLVLAVSMAMLVVYDLKKQPLGARFAKLTPAAKMTIVCLMAMLVLVFGMYGIGFNAESFIYSKF